MTTEETPIEYTRTYNMEHEGLAAIFAWARSGSWGTLSRLRDNCVRDTVIIDDVDYVEKKKDIRSKYWVINMF